ncbi:TIGR01777 family oxidoreductase [Atopomonas sediminilitoris]|uniref:TIGR01777 family oxidoreductase n=1 Tax=Atopomonas sediminilitoris TaxID=2919919 RepID=UPI001F4E527F|nr:TIGR01777 family oxidoreductase [Atopomonas sediminilitoris]MCJ8168085.1 TIGR01777 family oxidoreductase [Atopomonas sediminilitoris]
MHILITGGTGLIGRALCQHWLDAGHEVYVLSRRPHDVPELCGESVHGLSRLSDYPAELALDAVVNLAGEPIADKPWTAARRKVLWDSRVSLTEQLIDWLATREQKPEVLISGSAVGWYGDTGDAQVDEKSAPHSEDFAQQLCTAWELAASRAQTLGMRVVLLRTGLVLAPHGGVLARLLLPFKLGLGGPIGSGQQYMPWIHLDDEVALIDTLINKTDAHGPYNACAPNPVTNQVFSRSLARVLGRPAFLRVPAFALRTLLGELSVLMLGGQRVQPAKAQALGYTFKHTDCEQALKQLLT